MQRTRSTITGVLPPLAVVALVAVAGVACGPPAAPEIVAIEYLRATHTGESDDALALLDLDRIIDRIDDQIAIVHSEGDSEQFLRSSVETILWGLFQETPRRELTYDATPGDLEGDRTTVTVTMVDADGRQQRSRVHLRRTSNGWRVSGRSIDDLIDYVIQRLEERF